ncbi:hypothetical protein BDZ45DRAFT_654346 [Acephala macrosclerotiorum]|nr:hypothetical protein BDZ45DRAFT_654346 [Acephala macrosclerotiorum]
MARVLETKACTACGKAKRRCGKQTPQCLRCKTRGIDCRYPPSKPSQFVELVCADDETPIVPPESSTCCTLQTAVSSPVHVDTTLSSSLDIFNLPPIPLEIDQLASSWFSSQPTWLVRFPSASSAAALSTADLHRFIAKIRFWLQRWVDTGTNPFIHARLYQTRFPRCVKDDYAALTCYVGKTSHNERLVLKVVEDGVVELVGEYSTSARTLDGLDHIPRVQALLIYEIISLYDGDIRLRRLAESYIPILNKWMKEMVQVASTQSDSLGARDLSFPSPPSQILAPPQILSETIRRTWVVGSGIQVVYLALQGKGPMPCQGGMMFSTRKEVWEASSAVAWEKLCSEVHVGLMQMADAERLFGEVNPKEVNEFTKVLLEVCFGRERMERWGVMGDG